MVYVSVEQSRIDGLIADIQDSLNKVRRLMDRPYTADDAERYETAKGDAVYSLHVASTLYRMGITDAQYMADAIGCMNDLHTWRWAK